MRKASTALLEPGTQTPSPAPDLIPAENERQNLTGNSHSHWYNKRGHVKTAIQFYKKMNATFLDDWKTVCLEGNALRLVAEFGDY